MRFLFGPAILFFGLFKILLVVLLVVFLVRLFSHRHGHMGYMGHAGHWQGQGRWGTDAQDPRRIAAFRYAAGRIDKAEFDRIIAALDASEQKPPAPPAA